MPDPRMRAPKDVPVVAVIAPRLSSNLMRVTVQIGERRFDEDLAQQAMITPNIDALNDALATNPSRFGEWAMLEALARAELDEVKGNLSVLDSDIKDLEAVIYLEKVAPPDPSPAGWKPPTVDAIKASVTVDERRRALVARRQELEVAARESKAALDKLSVGRETIEQKKDSLIAICSNWRTEMQTQLSVNANKYRPDGRS